MRGNRATAQDHSILRAILMISIMTVVLFSGCISEDDDDSHHGPPPPPRPGWFLKLGNVIQSDMDCWDTNVTIYPDVIPPEYVERVDEITLVITGSERSILTDAQWTYRDNDANRVLSTFDVIEITNMTEGYQGSGL